MDEKIASVLDNLAPKVRAETLRWLQEEQAKVAKTAGEFVAAEFKNRTSDLLLALTGIRIERRWDKVEVSFPNNHNGVFPFRDQLKKTVGEIVSEFLDKETLRKSILAELATPRLAKALRREIREGIDTYLPSLVRDAVRSLLETRVQQEVEAHFNKMGCDQENL